MGTQDSTARISDGKRVTLLRRPRGGNETLANSGLWGLRSGQGLDKIGGRVTSALQGPVGRDLERVSAGTKGGDV